MEKRVSKGLGDFPGVLTGAGAEPAPRTFGTTPRTSHCLHYISLQNWDGEIKRNQTHLLGFEKVRAVGAGTVEVPGRRWGWILDQVLSPRTL